MASLQSLVTEQLKINNNLTLKELQAIFPDRPINTIRSCYRRSKVNATKDASGASNKITMEKMENMIMSRLNKKPSLPDLKLAVDFLKIKSQDHSELQEIDLDIFYKKAMEE